MKITPLPLNQFKRVFILTGAGLSVASGLPTYRGPGGIWEKADVARIADARNLPETLPDLWKLYRARREMALRATPNAAHRVIAEFQQDWRAGASDRRVTLVTQNVDDLHRRAGSDDVVEMHGSAFTTKCMNKRCESEPFRDETLYDDIPRCKECGSPLRPGVVLFGEAIPVRALQMIREALAECDLFLSVGTSGQVWPAAQFVEAAEEAGALTVSVNVERTDNASFQREYLGAAGDVLPKLFSERDSASAG